MNVKISLILVNYNSGDYLRSALVRLCETDPSVSVIIVDNASTDNSLDGVADVRGHVQIVHTGTNLGFAAAANRGALEASKNDSEIVFFVNPDALLEDHCIRELAHALTDSSVGAVAPVTYRDTGHTDIWFAGGAIDFWRMRATHTTTQKNSIFSNFSFLLERFFSPRGSNEKEKSHRGSSSCEKQSERSVPYKSQNKSSYLTGCVLGMRTSAFEEIGGFDERFFLYYEDADLSLRIRQSGLTIAVVPTAIAVHAEQSEDASVKKIYFLVLMGLLFFHKNTGGVLRSWFVFFTFVRYAFSIIKYGLLRVTRRDLNIQRSVLNAFSDYYAGRTHRHHVSHRKLR